MRTSTEILESVLLIAGIIAIVGGVSLLSAWLTMALWGAVMPAVFGLPELTLWQAFALNFLLSLVTGSTVRYSN